MKTVVYDNITDDAVRIRKEVFEDEQGFVDEFDEADKLCRHAVIYLGDEAVGTCRFYKRECGDYMLGRVAVKREHRGKHYGSQMLSYIEEYIKLCGGERISLHAQLQSKDFYEKQGFTASGEIELEQDCPHIWMSKDLIK